MFVVSVVVVSEGVFILVVGVGIDVGAFLELVVTSWSIFLICCSCIERVFIAVESLSILLVSCMNIILLLSSFGVSCQLALSRVLVVLQGFVDCCG